MSHEPLEIDSRTNLVRAIRPPKEVVVPGDIV
jgi:hypothetical protein